MQKLLFPNDKKFWDESTKSFMAYFDHLIAMGIILHLIGFFTYEYIHLDKLPLSIRYLRFIPIFILVISLILSVIKKEYISKVFDLIFILSFISSTVSLTIIQNYLNFGLNYFHNFTSISIIGAALILVFPLKRLKFHLTLFFIYGFYFYLADYDKIDINDLTFLIRTTLINIIMFSVIYHLLQSLRFQNFNMKDKLNQRNKELQEEIETKNEFVSLVAHDIRNPLQLILFISEYLNVKFKIGQTKNLESRLADLKDSVQDLINLSENLFAWINGYKGKLKAKKEIYDINNTIIKIFQTNKNIAIKKNIDLVYNLEDNGNIYADKNMLEIVIRNLLQNAIKFTPKGGSILIKSERLNLSSIKISIKDSGIGMPQYMIDDFLEQEKIISSKGTENEKGTGLGLLICKKYLMLNGSKMEISSQLYKGTTISFVLGAE